MPQTAGSRRAAVTGTFPYFPWSLVFVFISFSLIFFIGDTIGCTVMASALSERTLCIILSCGNKGSILAGDEEEAKRWNSRFSEDNSEKTEKQPDKAVNGSVAAMSNTDKVSGLFIRL